MSLVRLDDEGERSHVHLRWEVRTPLALRFLEPIVTAIFRRGFNTILHELKDQLESGRFRPAS